MTPYNFTAPLSHVEVVSARRYRNTVGRHTIKAALEHPQNEQEYRRARRTGAVHAALAVAALLPFTLVRAWASFTWDASRAFIAALDEQPAKAHAAAETTLALTGALTLLALAVTGWSLADAIKAFVFFALLVFPSICALLLRADIQWFADPLERKAWRARQELASEEAEPLLTLGVSESPPGLARAGEQGGASGA